MLDPHRVDKDLYGISVKRGVLFWGPSTRDPPFGVHVFGACDFWRLTYGILMRGLLLGRPKDTSFWAIVSGFTLPFYVVLGP